MDESTALHMRRGCHPQVLLLLSATHFEARWASTSTLCTTRDRGGRATVLDDGLLPAQLASEGGRRRRVLRLSQRRTSSLARAFFGGKTVICTSQKPNLSLRSLSKAEGRFALRCGGQTQKLSWMSLSMCLCVRFLSSSSIPFHPRLGTSVGTRSAAKGLSQ